MPTWTLTYQGFDDLASLERELQILRSDLACVRLSSTSSIAEPGVVHVEVEFSPQVIMTMESSEIIHSRMAEAVPMVPTIPISVGGVEILIDLGEHQEVGTMQVGLPVCIDEQGRIGRRGAPLGILVQVDREANQARIRQVRYESSVSSVELTRDQLFQRMPIPLPDPRVQQARRGAMAEEDSRFFEIMDSIAQASHVEPLRKPEKPNPEPRPVFKTRYERIMNALKK